MRERVGRPGKGTPKTRGTSRVEGLVKGLLSGDKRAAAKLISLIEDDEPEAIEALARIHPRTGRAHIVGFTGPPGVGKSSLINRLVRTFRERDRNVGVVAVDPTSPFTGGAVLGDRIRMAETGRDPGVFIRSMATRGHAGGLALATFDAVRVLDALGMDLVLVETVGAGQSEIEIAKRAHTTVVVEMPLSGDSVQVMKAGIFEIGDLYVVNKADLGDADALVANLRFQVEPRDGWTPPILRTSALDGSGVPEVADGIERHRAHLVSSGLLRAKEIARAREEILENARRLLSRRVQDVASAGRAFDRLAERVADRRTDPHAAALEVLRASGSRRRA